MSVDQVRRLDYTGSRMIHINFKGFHVGKMLLVETCFPHNSYTCASIIVMEMTLAGFWWDALVKISSHKNSNYLRKFRPAKYRRYMVSVADPGFEEGGFRDGALSVRAILPNIFNIHNFCLNTWVRNDHEAESNISCWHSMKPKATFHNTDMK